MSCADKSCTAPNTIAARVPVRIGPQWPYAAWRYCSRLLESRRQRRALLELDPHQLKDIGLSREQALSLANKLFWTRLAMRRAD